MSNAEESNAVNNVNAAIVVHNALRPGKRFVFWVNFNLDLIKKGIIKTIS